MPFMFGRYTYVGNDPINSWDPFGEEIQILGDDEYFEEVNAMLAVMQETEVGKAAVVELAESENIVIIAQPGYNKEIDKKFEDAGIGANGTIGMGGVVDGKGGDSIIYFDMKKPDGGEDDAGSFRRPPVVGLAHETGHAINNNRGENIPGRLPGGNSQSIPEREKRPLEIENAIRKYLNIPLRSVFDQQQ